MGLGGRILENRQRYDAQSVALSIQYSLKNREGEGAEIVGEARPLAGD
jgi:hypothetical protein